MSKSQACFKAGKYFLEGKEYKNAFSRLPLLADSKTKTIDLTIMFNYEDYIIRDLNLDIIQFISKIKEYCDNLDNFPPDLKNICISNYINWRDNILPEILEEERIMGEKKTIEPYIDEINSVFEA